MIHYHGGPITPLTVANYAWTRRHAFVSFWYPDQIAFAAEICQSFALDNGAFSAWMQGVKPDREGYRDWVAEWGAHPGCDFAIIPDVIDGAESDNDALIEWWHAKRNPCLGVPVWHLHESLDRFRSLCREHARVAIGSSGEWPDPNTPKWWRRINAAFAHICDERGRPPCRLHGLRMLNPTVFSQLPLASADSTNLAQNHWRERHTYCLSEQAGAIKMIDRIEEHASAPYWTATAGTEMNLVLVG